MLARVNVLQSNFASTGKWTGYDRDDFSDHRRPVMSYRMILGPTDI